MEELRIHSSILHSQFLNFIPAFLINSPNKQTGNPTTPVQSPSNFSIINCPRPSI